MTGGDSSLLRLGGNADLIVSKNKKNNTLYSFLWNTARLSWQPKHYARANVRERVQDINRRETLSKLNKVMQPNLDVLRERCCSMLSRQQQQENAQNVVEISEQAVEEGELVRR